MIIEDVERPASADQPHGDLRCEVCGEPLTYAGRGRKPTKCDKHKTQRARTATTSSRMNRDDKLRAELTSSLGTLGLGLMVVDVYDGLVVMDRAPQTVDALMEVAAHNPRVRKLLDQMVEVSVWAAFGTALAGMIVPIGVHHGLIPLPREMVEAQFISPETRESLANLPDNRVPRGKAKPRRAPAPEPPRPAEDSSSVGLKGG